MVPQVSDLSASAGEAPTEPSHVGLLLGGEVGAQPEHGLARRSLAPPQNKSSTD